MMIDLNEFKKSVVRVKSSHLINVFISDFDEIIDRATAAESMVSAQKDALLARDEVISLLKSERDELKSKLSQFEREIPKTPEGFPELDKEHLIKICIQQQSKLSEIEAQEPAIEYFMDGGFPNARFNGYQPKPGDKLYLQPIANNGKTVQRITEQDAREIVGSAFKYYRATKRAFFTNNWLEFGDGCTLLAKLNEHREPEVKQGEHVGIYWESKDGNERGVKFERGIEIPRGSKIYIEPVTPNKAEVPEGWKLVPIIPTEEMCDAISDVYEMTKRRGVPWSLFWQSALLIAPLPPLKDE